MGLPAQAPSLLLPLIFVAQSTIRLGITKLTKLIKLIKLNELIKLTKLNEQLATLPRLRG